MMDFEILFIGARISFRICFSIYFLLTQHVSIEWIGRWFRQNNARDTQMTRAHSPH